MVEMPFLKLEIPAKNRGGENNKINPPMDEFETNNHKFQLNTDDFNIQIHEIAG